MKDIFWDRVEKVLRKRIKNMIPNTCGLIITFDGPEQMVRDHISLG